MKKNAFNARRRVGGGRATRLYEFTCKGYYSNVQLSLIPFADLLARN